MPDAVRADVFRPSWVRAGFHADISGADSGLVHAGEQWAPARFLISAHSHPVWEFYLQVHGETTWFAEDEVYVLTPGHLLGVAPGVPHHMVYESSGRNHFFFAAIDLAVTFRRHPDLATDWGTRSVTVARGGAESLAESFRQVNLELTAVRRHGGTGLELAVDRLVLELTRRLCDAHPTSVLLGHPAVATVRALLDRDIARRWTLSDLSHEVGLAPGYLASLFTREIGLAPHRYLNECRVRQARHLLAATDLSVTAIGLTVGFGSGQHFARVFRQLTGQAPGEHRRTTRRAP